MIIKKVMRYDKDRKMFRVFRVLKKVETWGKFNYSVKFSYGLKPVIFCFYNEEDNVYLGLLGSYFHYQRSYGGVYV